MMVFDRQHARFFDHVKQEEPPVPRESG
jgi:hypothetical protein